MNHLLAVGELPPVSRSHPGAGRPAGKWRGNETLAHELRKLRRRVKDPERAWGKVAERRIKSQAQYIATAIKQGTAVGWEPTREGCFEVFTRKSPNQHRAPVDGAGRKQVLFDVWARYVPHEED